MAVVHGGTWLEGGWGGKRLKIGKSRAAIATKSEKSGKKGQAEGKDIGKRLSNQHWPWPFPEKNA